jgi:hypothetical protein
MTNEKRNEKNLALRRRAVEILEDFIPTSR